ncbi:ATP-binding protein [Salinimicrobium gaetbulicola]|uniref:histidine kinase n=1 Tax=Salinimicrobium gaetbulicola TaxID=999702 RepID=A0ABW3IGL4_9FLAO
MTSELPTIDEQIVRNKQLLILSDQTTSKIQFSNSSGKYYCGITAENKNLENILFLKDLVHPDDQEDFLSLLKGLKPGNTRNIDIRIRNSEGKWTKFHFTNRIYQPLENESVVLSLGHPVFEPGNEIQTIDPNYASLKYEYDNLISSLDEGFCMVDMIYNLEGEPIDYLYAKTNESFINHIKYHNIEGRTMREVVPYPQSKLIAAFSKVAKTGKPVRFDLTTENLGGDWLDMYVFKMGEKESGRVGLLFRNITSKKIEEETLKKELSKHHKNLKESNLLLQSVFDTTYLGIAVLKALYDDKGKVHDFRFVRTNKVLNEMFLKEDIIGQTYQEASKYGVEMGIFDAYKKVMKTGKPFDEEYFFDKEGFSNWFRVTARAQGDLLITTVEDITERKEKAQELAETLHFKHELVTATHDIIMIINLNTYTVRYINKDLVKESGLTRKNITGKKLQDVMPYIHPRDREQVIELHKSLLKSSTEKVFNIEVRLKLQAVSWEWFNVRAKVFQRKDKDWVDEYVLLIRNITNQKNTQKALIKAEKLSIQGEIARTFAHELRNPLASIGMVNEVLKQKVKAEGFQDMDNYFEILKRSTKTLNDLVTNLLNSSNYTPAVLKPEDLGEIIESTLHKAADRIYLSGIKVIKKYDGKFPILADKEKLEIALLNIIVNASEAIVPGKGIIKIEVSEHKSDFKLKIADNGQGMEEDQIDHLFEAFYTKKDKGMGIGMNSVKNILEEHDARIDVESQIDKGSTFCIYFHNENLLNSH